MRRWVVGSVGGWMTECVRGYGCSTCFVLLFSGPMVVSPRSLDDGVLRSNWAPLQLPYVICCTDVIRGWVDRFAGVTAVLRSAVLL